MSTPSQRTLQPSTCARFFARVLLSSAVACPAWAALGDDAGSIATDRQHLQAQAQAITSVAGYTVHEMRTPANTVVREFVSSAGRVFAVSWRGPILPDLAQMLGRYFTQYQDAAAAPHAGHRHLAIRQPDLVIESAGRMRAFHGFAYVPSLLPAGVPASAIQ